MTWGKIFFTQQTCAKKCQQKAKVSKVVSVHAIEAQIYSFLTFTLDDGQNLEADDVSIPCLQTSWTIT
jgi:Fe-S-cluster containining protein